MLLFCCSSCRQCSEWQVIASCLLGFSTNVCVMISCSYFHFVALVAVWQHAVPALEWFYIQPCSPFPFRTCWLFSPWKFARQIPKLKTLPIKSAKSASKIKSQVFMTAPLKLHEGTRRFQFPIAFVQRTPLVYLILLMCNCGQTHRYPMDLFPKLNISIKHRQIGGQSMRFALHNRFWITVGCLLLWRKIRWFQQSRGWLKGSGSSDVWQVSVGPTRASRLDPSLD